MSRKVVVSIIALLVLSVLLWATTGRLLQPDYAKLCSELSEKEQKPYSFGQGKLIRFNEVSPPDYIPRHRDKPLFYAAMFQSETLGTVEVRIPWIWKDASAPEQELVLAPLPISLSEGNHYAFCYEKEAIGSGDMTVNVIRHLDTIRQID